MCWRHLLTPRHHPKRLWYIYIYIYILCILAYIHRADSGLAPSQWETSLQSNAISHLAGRKPRISPAYIYIYIYIFIFRSWMYYLCVWYIVFRLLSIFISFLSDAVCYFGMTVSVLWTYLHKFIYIYLHVLCTVVRGWACVLSPKLLRLNWLQLTHFPLDKMAAILQTVFSDAFSWMKSFVFWSKFHWSLFLSIQLTKAQH